MLGTTSRTNYKLGAFLGLGDVGIPEVPKRKTNALPTMSTTGRTHDKRNLFTCVGDLGFAKVPKTRTTLSFKQFGDQESSLVPKHNFRI